MKLNLKTALVLFLGTMTLASCQKDGDTEDSAQLSENHALVESIFENAQTMADEAESGDLQSFKTTSCPTITRDTSTAFKRIVIDFGDTNCVGKDGRARRGKVIVVFTGRYREVGTQISITTEDYYVDDHRVEINRTTENKGPNADGHPEFTIDIDGRVVLADGSGAIVWESNRTRTWIEGDTTQAFADDVYLISGSGSRTSASGIKYTVDITKSLRVELDCRYITEGTIEFDPSNRPKRTLDYGEGTCDNIAELTINGRTREVTLRR